MCLQELGIALRGQSRLAGEKAELERVARQHLLWSGQALVASSLGVMEEAVQQIRTAFLMPSKELKCVPCGPYLRQLRRPGITSRASHAGKPVSVLPHARSSHLAQQPWMKLCISMMQHMIYNTSSRLLSAPGAVRLRMSPVAA